MNVVTGIEIDKNMRLSHGQVVSPNHLPTTVLTCSDIQWSNECCSHNGGPGACPPGKKFEKRKQNGSIWGISALI